MGAEEMKTVSALIVRVLKNHADRSAIDAVRKDVETLAEAFPAP